MPFNCDRVGKVQVKMIIPGVFNYKVPKTAKKTMPQDENPWLAHRERTKVEITCLKMLTNKNCLSLAGIQSRDRVQLFAQPLLYHSFSRDHLGPSSPGQCLSTLGRLALQDMTIVNKRS